MADREGRRERLRLGRDEPVEGRPAVPDRALRWLAAYHLAPLLRVVAGLRQRLLVLYHVLGRLYDHDADRVVPGPAGPSRDLVELARLQQPRLRPVVLIQRGEQHRADRHVDPDAE